MGKADGGFRGTDTRESRGEPMAAVIPMVRGRDRRELISGITAHARIKPPRISPLIFVLPVPPVPPRAVPSPVRDRPGSQPTVRPRAGRRDGAGPPAAARPRPGARGKEGGPI
jgi:hypothetical protein